jgi:plasmid stabilization system protein ParE
MTRSFIVTVTAGRQMTEAIEWWTANREKAPHILNEEIDRAIATIISQPDAGLRAPSRRYPRLRRILLRKTRRHLYYFLDEANDRIEIVGFWNATSKSRPAL